MSLQYVTLTVTSQDAGQDAGTGAVTVIPTSVVTASGVTVVSQDPVVRQLSGGTASVLLVASDNAGTSPASGFWAYSIAVGSGAPKLYLVNFANGATQRLDSLTPVLPLTTYGPAAGSGGFASPMTTLGDLIYENATPAPARLAGNVTAARNFLRQQGTGSVSAAPAWDTLQAGDIPAPAGVFRPSAFGGVANRVIVTDGAMTSGSPNLACTTSTPFTSTGVDGGKAIIVTGAGASGADLITTISTVTDSGHAVLAASAGATVSGRGLIFGTDATAAVQSALNAAVAYAQGAGLGSAELNIDGQYVIAGNPVKGGSTLGNSQLTLPVIAAATGAKVNLKVTGLSDVTAPPEHWLQTTLNAPGGVLISINGTGTYDATFGPSCVLGGPVSGYGGGGGTFSNMQLVVNGLTILTPWQGTIGGINAFGLGQADIRHFSCMPMAVVPSGTPWPQLQGGGPTSNQFPAGLIMPATGNNALADIGYYTCYGAYIALSGADHLTWQSLRTLYCGIGWLPASPAGECHAAAGQSWCCEATGNPILAIEGAVTWGGYKLTSYAPFSIQALDLETFTSFIIDGDTGSLLSGFLGIEYLRQAAQGTPQPYVASALQSHTPTVTMRLIESAPGPVASPQAAPASGSAWFNGYYRDAFITLHATTITAVSIDSTAQNGLAGSPAAFAFFLPAGHSYTPTYTGALTHTVCLL